MHPRRVLVLSYCRFAMFWTADPIGEGGDLSLTSCAHDFHNTTAACLVHDCEFYHSRATEKGAVLQVGSGDSPSVIDINRCFMVNASCGEVSSQSPFPPPSLTRHLDCAPTSGGGQRFVQLGNSRLADDINCRQHMMSASHLCMAFGNVACGTAALSSNISDVLGTSSVIFPDFTTISVVFLLLVECFLADVRRNYFADLQLISHAATINAILLCLSHCSAPPHDGSGYRR